MKINLLKIHAKTQSRKERQTMLCNSSSLRDKYNNGNLFGTILISNTIFVKNKI